jgi:RNA polymerase sigma-70 factor (sigma-E family)
VSEQWEAAVEFDTQFADFVRSYSGTLYRTALVLTRNRAAAEDLVQETFVKLYPAWSRVEQADAPVAYVRRTMVNTFLNSRRRSSGREILLAQAPDRAGAPDPAIHVGDQDLVRQLLDRLAPRPRAILVLRYLHDLSDAEIAAEIGCRRATVRSITSRALTALRNEELLRAGTAGIVAGDGMSS